MIYCVDPSADEPIMLLNKHIGFDSEDGMGVDGSLFCQELLQLDTMGKKRIQVWINCVGGRVNEGYNIVSAILKSNTPVDTYNVFMAASMGGCVFMAGRNRYMSDYAMFMMHMPSNPSGDPVEDKALNAYGDALATMLSAKCNCTAEEVRAMMKKTTYLNAEECYAKGFCTSIENTVNLNQKYKPITAATNRTDRETIYKQGLELITNLLPQNSHTMPNEKLMTKMGLNPAASEDSAVDQWEKMVNRCHDAEKIVTKVKEDSHQEVLRIQNKAAEDLKEIQNKLTAANTELETNKAELTRIKNQLTEKETAFTTLQAQATALQTDKDNAIAAQKKTAAETLVSEGVRSGRIKNEAKVIESWTKQAIADYDNAKEMIDSIPASKKATEITKIDASAETLQKLGTAEMRMLEIANRNKQRGSAVPSVEN